MGFVGLQRTNYLLLLRTVVSCAFYLGGFHTKASTYKHQEWSFTQAANDGNDTIAHARTQTSTKPAFGQLILFAILANELRAIELKLVVIIVISHTQSQHLLHSNDYQSRH